MKEGINLKNTGDSFELVDLLRRAILTGEFKPRERLIETELAEKYHVSRTPVREAIKHLEALGLVKREKYKGAVVVDINPNEIREMLIVRAHLEGLAASLAATRLTPEELTRLSYFEEEMERAYRDNNIQLFSAYNESFHQIYYWGSGNRYLYNTILNLLKHTWHEPTTSWKGLGDVPLTIQGHKNILRALRERDPEKARIAAQQHTLDAVYHNELPQQGDGMIPPDPNLLFRYY